MSDVRMPRSVAAILRRLLPDELLHDVMADLESDARRRLRTGGRGRLRVGLWYLVQALSPSMLRLAWRLRRREGKTMSVERRSATETARASSVMSDFRQAGRGLRRSPFFALAAVASLGLGVGANTAVFSVANSVLLRPLPYLEPDRLVFVWNQIPGFELSRLPLSGIQITELRKEEPVLEDVAGIWATTRTLSAEDRALLASSGVVTPNFFDVLGAEPALGRTFLPEEGLGDGSTVIISDGLWRREFGAEPDVLGRTVQLEGGEAVIVGVLPTDFKLIFPAAVGVPEELDLYEPFPWVAAQPGGPRFLRTVARIRPGVSVEAADATVKGVAERLRQTYADIAELGDEFAAVPLHSDTVERIRPVLLALVGGVWIFLLLTSVNVASLLLARSTARRREFAIRTCLGASRRRLARLLWAEVGILAALGGVVGLLLGWWGARFLWALRPEDLARVDDVGLDPLVLGVTVAAAIVAGAVAGFAPRLSLRRRGPIDLLRRSSASVVMSRGRQLVTAAQLALAVVLVVGAGLLGQTSAQLRGTDLGFEPRDVLTFRVGLSLRQFPTDEERAELAQQIEDELNALPGVVSAGGGSHIPLSDWANWSGTAPPEGTPEQEREGYHFDHRSVTPGYLDALGATLVEGRFFRADDVGSGQPVVIVDQALAERAFPDRSPVGSRLLAIRYVQGSFEPTPAVVVGVIRNIRDHSPAVPSAGQVFWPFSLSARWELTYAVRTSGNPTELVDAVAALIPQIRGDLAAADFRTMRDYVRASMAETGFTSLVAGLFSGLALALAALGLYGVVSYSAGLRTKEMGVHLALGAQARDIFVRVVREGLSVTIVGMIVGLAGAAGLTRYLEALLFEVDPLDPFVFGGVATLLGLVAVVASLGPALRSSRLDPASSLRPD